jgi:hypothetical protein
MATYHMTVERRPAQLPGLDHPPLSPRDIVADSEKDALGTAESSMAEVCHAAWEYVLNQSGGDEALAAAQSNFEERWQIVVRRVDRPAVDFKARASAVDIVRDGQFVGTHYNYSGPEGEQSCDILLDGAVSGRLVGRMNGSERGDERIAPTGQAKPEQPMRRWVLDAAADALAPLVGRHWDAPVRSHIVDYPALEALADIRAALDARSGGPPRISDTIPLKKAVDNFAR